MGRRHKGRSVDGIVLLDKAGGASSNRVLQQVKRLYGAAKAGHTGALDPLATGLLPICLGEATKFSQFLLDSDKRYLTTAKLGIRTDSSDADGAVIEERAVENVSAERINALLEAHFRGEITQVPSMYSALKHQGQPLYKLARKGIKVEVKPRQVMIYSIELLAFRGDELDLDIRASKGTYVRSIVEDLGLLLGCGAHVKVLRRVECGPYRADQMLTLAQLEAIADHGAENATEEHEQASQAALDDVLLAPWSAVDQLPKVTLSDEQAAGMMNGRAVPGFTGAASTVLMFRADGHFIGLGEIQDDATLVARRLIRTSQ